MDTLSDVFRTKPQNELSPQEILQNFAVASLEAKRWKIIAGMREQELARITDERDMLAASVRELLQDRAALRAQLDRHELTQASPDPIHAAIDAMQRGGVR